MAVDVGPSLVGTIGGEAVIGKDCEAGDGAGSMNTVRVEVEVRPMVPVYADHGR